MYASGQAPIGRGMAGCLLKASAFYFHSIGVSFVHLRTGIAVPPSVCSERHTRTHPHTHAHQQGHDDECLFNGLGAGRGMISPGSVATASRGNTDCCRATGRPTWHRRTREKQLHPNPPEKRSRPNECMAQVCQTQNRTLHCICVQLRYHSPLASHQATSLSRPHIHQGHRILYAIINSANTLAVCFQSEPKLF